MGLKNKDGVDIKDVWRNGGIKSYLGMTFGGFPNCFMIYSPHGEYSLFRKIDLDDRASTNNLPKADA